MPNEGACPTWCVQDHVLWYWPLCVGFHRWSGGECCRVCYNVTVLTLLHTCLYWCLDSSVVMCLFFVFSFSYCYVLSHSSYTGLLLLLLFFCCFFVFVLFCFSISFVCQFFTWYFYKFLWCTNLHSIYMPFSVVLLKSYDALFKVFWSCFFFFFFNFYYNLIFLLYPSFLFSLNQTLPLVPIISGVCMYCFYYDTPLCSIIYSSIYARFLVQ